MPETLENLPAELDLTFYRGDTWLFEFDVADEADQPVEFVTARLQVRTSCEQGEVLLELSTANGRIVIDPQTRKARLNVPLPVSQGVDWDSGVYDLEVTFGSGQVETHLRGAFRVEGDITQ